MLAVVFVAVIGVVAPGGAADTEGHVTYFSAGITATLSGIIAGPDGNLWFTARGRIGRITPKGKVTEFSAGLTLNPSGIIAGPDGNLWFVEEQNSTDPLTPPARIGRITPAGVITEFVTDGYQYGMLVGPDGNLWFTESVGPGRITPAGEITRFSAGITGNVGSDIAVGPDGNLWFIEQRKYPELGSTIGRITPAGEITEFPASADAYPQEITAGPDGNLWFIEPAVYDEASDELRSGRIWRITSVGEVTEFIAGITPGSRLGEITAGPDRNLWFIEEQSSDSALPPVSRIGRITPAGVITEFSAGITGTPSGLTTGCDGNLWFTEADGKRIGRITPKGKVTEFPIAARPFGITAGPDGNLWFTTGGNRIGRIGPGPATRSRGRHGPTLPAACPRPRG